MIRRNRWSMLFVVLVLSLAIAASMGVSLNVALESQKVSNPTKADEVVLQYQAEQDAAIGGIAPSGPPPWTPDRDIHWQIGGLGTPSMATDRDGHLWVVFDDGSEPLTPFGIRVYESTDRGNTWSVMGSVSLSNYDLVNPAIAIDPYDNRVYVVYERVYSNSDHDIWCGVYTPGAGWSWNIYIDNTVDYDTQPSITCEYQYGSSNCVYVSYEEQHHDQQSGKVIDTDLMFAKSSNHGASWTVKTLAGSATGPDPNSAYCESSITNAQGRIYVACRHSADGQPVEGESDLWVHISSNRGATWAQRQVVNNSAGPIGAPSIAATHGGYRVVAAYDSDVGVGDWNRDVYYVYSADGGTTWSAPMGLATSVLIECDPVLTVDGCGSTSNTIYGSIHAVYAEETTDHAPGLEAYRVKYRRAAYNALWPAAWSTPQESGGGSAILWGMAVTTQRRSAEWYPCVAWQCGGRMTNVYRVMYSTIASGPTVITNAADPVGAETATLQGNLTDLGTAASVQVSFEWGTTTGYGNETVPLPMTTAGPFSAAITGLTPGVTYHFRAKAVGDGTAYGMDRTSGQGNTPPPAPTLISPANGANVPGTSVTFQWNASPGATKYFLIVSTNPSLSATLSNSALRKFYGQVSSTQHTVTGFPNTGTTYYWWVYAGNAYGWCTQAQVAANGGWAVVNGGGTPTVPPAPTLLSPANGANVPGTSVTFQWNASPGATKYFLIVSTNPSLSATLSNSTLRKFYGQVSSTQHTVTGFPNTGTTYYWWVYAGNSYGWCTQAQVAANGGWAVVNGGGTPTVPPAPTLLSPAGGANVPGTSVTFQWNASAGATKYFLIVSTNPSLSATLSNSALRKFYGQVNSTQHTVTGFPNMGTNYYWWVYAGNSYGWCPQAQVVVNGGWAFVNGS